MISKVLNHYYFKIVNKKLKQYPAPDINRKNIYIFPTKDGFQLGLFLITALIASTIYQINLGLIILVTLSVLFFLSILITYENLNQIKIQTHENIIDSHGKEPLTFILQNLATQQKINLKITDQQNELISQSFNLSIGANVIKIKNPFLKRGCYEYPLLKIETLFPFGITRAWNWFQLKNKFYVYPAPIMYFKDLNHFLVETVKYQSDLSEDFDGIDQFQEGMSESKIAWKISSSKEQLYVKKFESKSEAKKILIDYNQIPIQDHEKKLGIMVYLLKECLQQNKIFAIKIKNQISEYGDHKKHFEHCLKLIAEAD